MKYPVELTREEIDLLLEGLYCAGVEFGYSKAGSALHDKLETIINTTKLKKPKKKGKRR